MEVKFLSRAQTQATLVALVEGCDSMQWAVAWATENAVFEAAMKCSSKFEHFVVGTHMFQTQPEVLERAEALAAAAVVPPTGDLFHLLAAVSFRVNLVSASSRTRSSAAVS